MVALQAHRSEPVQHGTQPVRLWLVRHAQPLINAGVCYGAREVPVSEAGTQEAAHALVQTWRLQGVRPSALWVSPRERTQVLARAIAQIWADASLEPQMDARLREFDFGQWEGVPWQDIPKSAIDTWTDDFAHHRMGGQDCTADLVQRVHRALCDMPRDVNDVVWVTHAGVMRAVQWLLQHRAGSGAALDLSVLRADQWPRAAPSFGQWQTVVLPSGA